MSQDSNLEAAVTEYIQARTLEDARRILKARQAVLLSDGVETALNVLMVKFIKNDNPAGAQLAYSRVRLLKLARQQGIDQAVEMTRQAGKWI